MALSGILGRRLCWVSWRSDGCAGRQHTLLSTVILRALELSQVDVGSCEDHSLLRLKQRLLTSRAGRKCTELVFGPSSDTTISIQ